MSGREGRNYNQSKHTALDFREMKSSSDTGDNAKEYSQQKYTWLICKNVIFEGVPSSG